MCAHTYTLSNNLHSLDSDSVNTRYLGAGYCHIHDLFDPHNFMKGHHHSTEVKTETPGD